MNATNQIESLIEESLAAFTMNSDGSQPISMATEVKTFKAEHPFHSSKVAAMVSLVAAILPTSFALAKVVCL